MQEESSVHMQRPVENLKFLFDEKSKHLKKNSGMRSTFGKGGITKIKSSLCVSRCSS
jgi:hypothetical protein